MFLEQYVLYRMQEKRKYDMDKTNGFYSERNMIESMEKEPLAELSEEQVEKYLETIVVYGEEHIEIVWKEKAGRQNGIIDS